MANELIKGFTPLDGTAGGGGRPTGTFGSAIDAVAVGFIKGSAFPPQVDSSLYYIGRVPNAATLGTGLTAEIELIDDPLNPGPGKNVVLDVTYGPLTSGTTTPDGNVTTGAFVSTTADAATVTVPSGALVIKNQSIASVVAHTNSLAAGGWCLVRLRRLGTSASDTHPGRVVVFGLDVRNT